MGEGEGNYISFPHSQVYRAPKKIFKTKEEPPAGFNPCVTIFSGYKTYKRCLKVEESNSTPCPLLPFPYLTHLRRYGFHWISDPLMLSCNAKRCVFSDHHVCILPGWALHCCKGSSHALQKPLLVFLTQHLDMAENMRILGKSRINPKVVLSLELVLI